MMLGEWGGFDVFRWAEPWWLLLLLLLFARPRFLERLNSPSVLKESWVTRRLQSWPSRAISSPRRRVRQGTLVAQTLALICLILALARPQWLDRQAAESEGIDIALLVDSSSSMRFPFVDKGAMSRQSDKDEATPATKFEVAVSVLEEFVQARNHDRLALLSFAGSGRIESPLTLDHQTVLEALRKITPAKAQSPQDGTAIGLALALGSYVFDSSPSRSRVAILLTDGENNREDVLPIEGLELCRELGVRVSVVSVVSDEKSLLSLGALAKASSGRLYVAEDEAALGRIYQEIDALETARFEEERLSMSWRDVSSYPVGLAGVMALLVVATRRFYLRSGH